ncbi:MULTISPECIES: hypothetical protein [unclassified Arsukibacterium]|uniref:transglycosylase SLT domain-containing protein n=1 Tax=unclassified Arsukibacterium TaxID=2635278 RepID=UPI0025B8F5DA|nr:MULTISPECIES: hypothetical protein [unclassified Arsukibacterium]|tara:strand:+ start:23180 stop:23821 length:642 start_codon:yes stop_codon:yes gene_type:complete
MMKKVQTPHKHLKKIVVLSLAAVLSGCSTPPPQNTSDICEIFRENRSWYHAAAAASEKWGMPIALPMSIMYQESSFKHNARPPMRWFIGFIPYGRGSSAYGYSQAKTVTWDEYVKEADRFWASRNDFADAIDFMGWYIDKTYRLNKVSKWDGYHQYLNYHEGWGGYRRGSYKNKAWLSTVARRVDDRAKIYSAQLKKCEKDLQRGWLWRLFFD